MYILKQRHEEKEISSIYLWQQVLMEAEASTPFQRLKSNILFILQLLILLLGIFALTSPFLKLGNKNYENLIIVIDTTGSMSAFGQKETRLEEAKKKGEEIINSTPSGSKITLITSSIDNKIEISASTDKKEITKKIREIIPTNSSGNINDTYSIVKSISEQYDSYKILYLTDTAVDFKNLNGEVISFASERENLSLDYISHSKVSDGIKIMMRVTNHGKNPSKAELLLYGVNSEDADKLLGLKEVELSSGETKTVYFDKIKENIKYVRGEISGKDSLNEDNKIYSIIEQKDRAKILLYSQKNVFLEKVLSNIKDIELVKTNPGEKITEDFDLYIFDKEVPESLSAKGSLLFINPTKAPTGFNIGSEVKGGKGSVATHTITRFMENSNFTVSSYKKVEAPYWAAPLIKIEGENAAYAGEYKGQKQAIIAFDFQASDLPLTAEFPIFINNLMTNLLNRDTIGDTQYLCGEKVEVVPLPEAEKLWVTTPKGDKINMETKYPIKPLEKTYEAGVYNIVQRFSDNETSKLIAVNFPTTESDLLLGTNSTASKETQKSVSTSGINIRNILIIIVIVLMALEWFYYIRLNAKIKTKTTQ
jgi:hypothetical protein